MKLREQLESLGSGEEIVIVSPRLVADLVGIAGGTIQKDGSGTVEYTDGTTRPFTCTDAMLETDHAEVSGFALAAAADLHETATA